jgi:chemotaxis-related protein WspB
MKVLVFTIGPDRYALRLAAIERVLPVAALKSVALAPPWVAGLLDLHGEPVPVIDMGRLAGMSAEQVWFDTRIVLADYALGGATHACIGLLCEHVIGIADIAPDTLRDGGVAGARFLGQVASTADGMLQLVEIGGLLPPEVRTLLFAEQAP